MKKLTTNKALALLAAAALLNEDIISFLNGCYLNDGYRALCDTGLLIVHARYGTVLYTSVEVVLDCEYTNVFLREILHEATKKKDFGTARKASHLLRRLISLSEETGGEKTGTE